VLLQMVLPSAGPAQPAFALVSGAARISPRVGGKSMDEVLIVAY
jgi:hypothetical protein